MPIDAPLIELSTDRVAKILKSRRFVLSRWLFNLVLEKDKKSFKLFFLKIFEPLFRFFSLNKIEAKIYQIN